MSETSNIVGPGVKKLKELGFCVDRLNAGSPNYRMRGLKKGTADIMIVLPPRGRVGYLEAKIPGAKPRKDQEHQVKWAENRMALGALHAVVTSVREIVETARRWAREEMGR